MVFSYKHRTLCYNEYFSTSNVYFVTLCVFRFIMVALWNRADHYIIAWWFLLSFFFFSRLISAVGDWMSAIIPHMVWP